MRAARLLSIPRLYIPARRLFPSHLRRLRIYTATQKRSPLPKAEHILSERSLNPEPSPFPKLRMAARRSNS